MKWVCIKCFKTKMALVFDWAVQPYDHFICIDSFKAHAEKLKSMYNVNFIV